MKIKKLKIDLKNILYEKILSQNFFLTLNIFLLYIYGLASIYYSSNTSNILAERQLTFGIIGLALYFLFASIDYINLSFPLFYLGFTYISILILFIDLFVGKNVNGAARWIALGFVNFQPSEIAKFAVILICAGMLSQKKKNFYLFTFLSVLIIFLVFKEPSLSSAITILITILVTVFISMKNKLIAISMVLLLGLSLISGFILITNHKLIIYSLALVTFEILICGLFMLFLNISTPVISKTNEKTSKKTSKLKEFIYITLAIFISFVTGVLIFSIGWNHLLQPYQKQRILSFLYNKDKSTSYQITQAEIAIGSGEIYGGGTTQTRLDFLPEYSTDFIFATSAEEFGFIGVSILILLYFFLINILSEILQKTTDDYSKLFISGVILIISIQTTLNILINLGKLPTTGIPLPFMSSGGSDLIIMFCLLGIVQSIYRHTKANRRI